MEYRKLTVTDYAQVIACHPEFAGLGIDRCVQQAYNVIFPDVPALTPRMAHFNNEQLNHLQGITDFTLSLIKDTNIIPINPQIGKQPQNQLHNTNMHDLPHILRLIILSKLSEYDSSLAGKRKHRRGKKIWEINNQTEFIPTAADIQRQEHAEKAQKQNVIYPAAAQDRLTAARRWFKTTYGIMPECLYAAGVFYILDYIMTTKDIDSETYGVLLGTILNLAKLVTYNLRQKSAAQQSLMARL